MAGCPSWPLLTEVMTVHVCMVYSKCLDVVVVGRQGPWLRIGVGVGV